MNTCLALAKRAIQVLVLLAVVSLLVGQLLGQPLLLGYVETDSMEPTMEPQDGFVALPPALTGPPDRGDIVVYRAENLQGGGLTTHRVVERTEEGYITKGDKNPFTDQSGPEPVVKPEQIEAVVLQLGGHAVVIPELGTVVTGTQAVVTGLQVQVATLLGTRSFLGTQGLSYLLFLFALGLYGIDVLRSGDRDHDRHRERETGTNLHVVVAVAALLVVGGATVAMVGGGGTQKFDVISVERDSPGVRYVEQGTSESVQYNVTNGGFLPEVVVFEPATEGIAINSTEMTVPPRSMETATITLTAPRETGYARRYLVEHRYPALLPTSHIRALYALHPWAPVVVIDALLGGGVYLLGLVLVDNPRVRVRTRDRPSRLARLFSRISN